VSRNACSTLKLATMTTIVVLVIAATATACGGALTTPARSPTATGTPAGTPMFSATNTPELTQGVVEGWAVLAEKDYYSDVGMTDLPIDYINVGQMSQLLAELGWQESHVRELRDFDREDLRQALAWLAGNADEDDVVLLYVSAHGVFLDRVVEWVDFFAADWAAVPSPRRVLVIDACQAALYTAVVADDPQPHVSVASVDSDEYGWCGLEEEGLPIIGGVFTHYFAAAFGDSEADADGNGTVSVQEAALHAQDEQRSYMHEVVFAVPEFAESYEEVSSATEDRDYPHVIVDDTVGESLYLELDLQ
jgi:hypothetical protein